MTSPDFDGQTYDRTRDHDRLARQQALIRSLMSDHEWHTLAELAEKAGEPEASISARLRDLRKPKFGGYTVDKRYIEDGQWEYRMSIPTPPAQNTDTPMETSGSGPLKPDWDSPPAPEPPVERPEPKPYVETASTPPPDAKVVYVCQGVKAKTLSKCGDAHSLPLSSTPEGGTTDEAMKWVRGRCYECSETTIWKGAKL